MERERGRRGKGREGEGGPREKGDRVRDRGGEASGSNPLRNVGHNAESLDFTRFSAFLFFC